MDKTIAAQVAVIRAMACQVLAQGMASINVARASSSTTAYGSHLSFTMQSFRDEAEKMERIAAELVEAHSELP